MDIRTWQEADRPDLPEPGFGEDPAGHGALGFPGSAHPADRRADSMTGPFGASASGTSFTATDVISLGPADRSGRGSRSVYSARHRSGRSPFSPLRPAPIAIGSLSTAAIAAFAFVGPGILHGGDAASTTPILDGVPHRIAPLTPGTDASSASASAGDPAAAGSSSIPGTPTAAATGSTTGANGPNAPGATSSGPAGHTASSSPSGPGHTPPDTPPSTPPPSGASPSGPGHPTTPAPPSGDPSRPAPPSTGQPPTPPPSWAPVSPPAPPTSPPTQPPTTAPVPVFNAAAAVSSALTEISTARASFGADTLSVDPSLAEAASRHTSDMIQSHKFSHTGSDGSTPFSRAQAVGCWTLSKELIARGRPGDDVVGALLKDSQSRPALLSYMNASVGISAQQDPATGDVYWTIELAWL